MRNPVHAPWLLARLLLVCMAVCLLIPFVAIASALDIGPVRPDKPEPEGVYEGGGREGGDTVGEAYPIPALPFSDVGNTCGFANDYDEVCPYSWSTAPDVVYSFSPPASMTVCLELCTAAYDTKMYVWQDAPGQLVACSDDACGETGYQSRIPDLDLFAGHEYYIVIDGYGSECGDYDFRIVMGCGCELDCPEGGELEGEPLCQDDYIDGYNSGCHTGIFQPLEVDPQGMATMCGKSCTYLFNGFSYRDTDWFTADAAGGTVTATCTAEFPLMIVLFLHADCGFFEYVYAMAGACETVVLDWQYDPGDEVWFWVGPSVFTGIEESDYVFQITGLEPGIPSPAVTPTWGAVKDLFR